MRKLLTIAPPGLSIRGWKSYLATSLLIAVAVAGVWFLSGMYSAISELYDPWTKELLDDAVMWSFSAVLGKGMRLFELLAAGMGVFVFANYHYFFRGSKSIYTMARLKNPWALHKLCWTLPVLGASALLLCRWLLTGLCYLCYLLATPKGYLPQW